MNDMKRPVAGPGVAEAPPAPVAGQQNSAAATTGRAAKPRTPRSTSGLAVARAELLRQVTLERDTLARAIRDTAITVGVGWEDMPTDAARLAAKCSSLAAHANHLVACSAVAMLAAVGDLKDRQLLEGLERWRMAPEVFLNVVAAYAGWSYRVQYAVRCAGELEPLLVPSQWQLEIDRDFGLAIRTCLLDPKSDGRGPDRAWLAPIVYRFLAAQGRPLPRSMAAVEAVTGIAPPAAALP